MELLLKLWKGKQSCEFGELSKKGGPQPVTQKEKIQMKNIYYEKHLSDQNQKALSILYNYNLLLTIFTPHLQVGTWEKGWMN